jgi:hypothetical protein
VPIEHVVVLCLENRSFDQMLGFLDHLDPKFGGLLHGGPGDNAGWDLGSRVPGGRKKLAPRPNPRAARTRRRHLKDWHILRKARCSPSRLTAIGQAILTLHHQAK